MDGGYDLQVEPWIPVLLLSGQRERLGLRDVFKRAHEIDELEVPVPPAAAGLLRILAAITARIAGDGEEGKSRLDDPDVAEEIEDWLALRERVLRAGRFDPDAVDAYFDRDDLAGRFDLFDPARPFLQDPRLRQECVDAKGVPNTSGVNKLVLGRPTGVNGAVLFGHFTDTAPVPVPAAEAAWHLIAQLYYGPSGQCTPRRSSGKRIGNSTAGPLRKSISYFPWGPDLFTTLLLAVPSPQVDVDWEMEDTCPWETDLGDPLGPLPPLTWPGRMLTGRFRHAALLVPSPDGRMVTDAYLTWATHEPPHEVHDPFLILDRREDGGFQPRVADGARALWRDLDSLLLKDNRQNALRPPALEHLPRDLLPRLRVRAYGFDQDGQQKDRVWFKATSPQVLQWLEENDAEMAHHIKRCHVAAEETGKRLDFAARVAWKLATDTSADPSPKAKIKLDPKNPGPWAAAALTQYWPAAEAEFWRLTKSGPTTHRVTRAFVDAALAALDEAIGQAGRADIRVARARNRARNLLMALLQPSTPG
ncbi:MULTISPECIES: type I-E CRISPR-associated protein Cse1/CasA [Streptomyces]|uniref:Type I-E CRISPR-associated protein Cse1/CasA n=1 Tax=Streptomyces thermoviolaceus subsp. thermoviolaceus TaxID=66860 RepID=A0ABX0YSQ6_STRTL|nr:type I-E CRISPR-associated protein Cse1/CasA [Streptomyces thermoviolaceus]NJP15369.1 type I-E CRISPR-associated protein Cse1/CasA [Streptomyces thermoviolaceus subsp. thermoviolaceus]GHB11744.1 hypothetical protein GCM10010512_49010 [Streptomyces thermoviolaceus subsp. thermoviolaceus]